LRGSKFLKMDDNLNTETVLSFSAPSASSGVVIELVGPPSELVDSEEEGIYLWGVEDGECWGGDGEGGDLPYPLGDSPLTTCLKWDLMGEPYEEVDVILEAHPERLRVEGSF